jgi:CHAD domain-containing protein
MAAGHKIEIEMKFEVAVPGGGDRYLVAPELGPFTPSGPVSSLRVEDRYVDSADWALARAGFAARMRKTSRGSEISLKALSTSGGRLQRREEIEGPTDAHLKPRDWPASHARNVVLELCGDEPLVEMLTIRQLRRLRNLKAGGTRAEMSLDEVEIVGDGRVLETFEELEVELKRGNEAPLQALLALFDGDDALRAVSESKLVHAIRAMHSAMASMPPDLRRRWQAAPHELLDGQTESPAAPAAPEESDEKAEPTRIEAPVEAVVAANDTAAAGDAAAADGAAPADEAPSAEDAPVPDARPKPGPRSVGIVAEDSMPEAARKVLQLHFSRMQRREAGTRSGVDTEELHDMRVATRRMRAAWRVFDGAFKAGKTKKIRRHLETIADRLGAVRDLDVLMQGLEAYRLGLDGDQQPGLDPLLSLWRKQRASARNQLIGELDSDRYASFIAEMAAFLDAGAHAAAAVATPTAPHRVRDRAASEIWASYEAVRAYELVFPWADLETLHDLRIATKWLRYALEFFGETLGPDAPRLLERVSALQDHLGCLHDADVATKLSRDVLVARAGELSELEAAVIGAYLRSREREVARLRRSLGPIWRAVSGAPFRRALGRATAAL